jgi:hypothetical protein
MSKQSAERKTLQNRVMTRRQSIHRTSTAVKRCFCHASLHQGFKLKEEIDIFLSDGYNSSDAHLCCNEDFIQKLVYLVDIFEEVINVNSPCGDRGIRIVPP